MLGNCGRQPGTTRVGSEFVMRTEGNRERLLRIKLCRRDCFALFGLDHNDGQCKSY